MLPELRQLRYFLTVAEELNFSRAAARLYVSQQSLSAQIQALEARIGAPLFTRTSRRVELTAAGTALLEPARRSIAEAERGVQAARRAAASAHSALAIGFLDPVLLQVTRTLLQAFTSTHPSTGISMRHGTYTDPTGGVREGSADVAFVLDILDRRGLQLTPLATVSIVAILPSNHSLTASPTLSLTQLFDLPWCDLATSDLTWRAAWLALPYRHRPPYLGPTVETLEDYLEVVRTGLGIGLATDLMPAHYPRPGLAYIPVHDAPKVDVCLARRAGPVPVAVKTFTDLARRLFPQGATASGV